MTNIGMKGISLSLYELVPLFNVKDNHFGKHRHLARRTVSSTHRNYCFGPRLV